MNSRFDKHLSSLDKVRVSILTHVEEVQCDVDEAVVVLVGAVGRSSNEQAPVSHALMGELSIRLTDLTVQVSEERELTQEKSHLGLLRVARLDDSQDVRHHLTGEAIQSQQSISPEFHVRISLNILLRLKHRRFIKFRFLGLCGSLCVRVVSWKGRC